MERSPEVILDSLRSGNVTTDLKRTLARGLMPLSPPQLIESLILLADDKDAVVKEEAQKSLERLPISIVRGVCVSSGTPTPLLDSLARRFFQNEMVLEELLLNSETPDHTVAYIATLPFPALLNIIGRNYLRLERDPQIMKNLKANPQTPPEVINLWQEHQERRQAPVEDLTDGEEGAVATDSFPARLVEEEEGEVPAALPEFKEEVLDTRQLSIFQALKKMTMGQKISMAVKGNREVRNFLIREKNRILCVKVLENPRLTDSDIEAYAKSTTVSEDVLRGIGNKREWCKKYPVVRALVNNPRTPLGISLEFLKRLRLRELEGLSKNRNVPDTLRSTARRLFAMKRDSRR